MNDRKLLPIGTVVLLNNSNKKAMIIGFLPIDTNSEEPKMYDYFGCFYPEGVLTFEEIYMFNNEMIKEIFHKGYECDEETAYKEELKDSLDEAREMVREIDLLKEKAEKSGASIDIFNKLRVEEEDEEVLD